MGQIAFLFRKLSAVYPLESASGFHRYLKLVGVYQLPLGYALSH